MSTPDKVSAFFQTITPEILGPSEYTDWTGIEAKVIPLRREIALVQSIDKLNPGEDLADLLLKHPSVLKVLQILIAHTPDKIHFNDSSKTIDFKIDLIRLGEKSEAGLERAKQIANTFVEMGIVDFLKRVRSVEDVVKGVLVGLEPNIRKNRRGTKLETEMNSLITTVVEEFNKSNGLSLHIERQMYVNLASERKKIDYVLLQGDKPRLAIEVNFYSVSGSKPSEVLGRAYPEVQASLKSIGVGFAVITDGYGWRSMKPVMATAQQKLDYVMTIEQARTGALYRVLQHLLLMSDSPELAKAA